MTHILTLVVAASLITQALAQTPAPAAKPTPLQLAETYYLKGQMAEKAGDPVAAKQAYQAALQANPKHANARYSLGQVKINAGSIAAGGREAKFGAVMIPEFNITDATLTETLDYLRVIMDKQTQGKEVPNFVIQDPKKQLADIRINLKLKNTPARGVMKYLMDQAGARVRYDEFAIVVIPLGAPK